MTEPSSQSLSPKAIANGVVGEYRELTVAAVILGVVQGIILNLSFVYAGLKLGFTIGGSTVAAIMGYALLRGVMKKGTSIENNINQTIASGINIAGAGIIFTFPAMFLLDAKMRAAGGPGLNFSLAPFLVAAIAGSILGVVVIIPLRKQMIDLDRLRFPSGVATASIIRSGAGTGGMRKAKLLIGGAAVSAVVKLMMMSDTFGHVMIEVGGRQIPFILEEELYFGLGVIPDYLTPIIALSLMNIAAGLLAGRGGLPFFFGGALAWWVLAPVAVSAGWVPPSSAPFGGVYDHPQWGVLYGTMIRPLGIGVLIGGALAGVVVSFPAIKSALKSLSSATKSAGAGKGSNVGSDEMPLWVLSAGILVALVLFFIASSMTPGVSTGQAAVSAVVGTVWLGVAALIVAQATGMTDISPMSGMALISVTLMMFILNKNIAGAMVVGVAVSVAIGQGADMMQDLKTGFMIGGRPIKQSLVQFGVAWIGPIVAMGAVYVLWKGGPGGENGFGPGSPLPAPQAGALMGIIDSVASGNIPTDKYALGAIIGGLLGAAPAAGLGVLVGLAMYLPFSITFGYGIGCFIEMGLQKLKGRDWCENTLVPVAAGLIVGEAMTGMVSSFVKIFMGGE